MPELESKPIVLALAFTVLTTLATAAGTLASSYLLVPMRMREEAEKARVERRAKGAQLRCEKLLAAVVLAAKVEFVADRGYSNKTPDEELLREQLELEERSVELKPFLATADGELLGIVVLNHYTLTQLRTSKVPLEQRAPERSANQDLNAIRNGARELGTRYRRFCSDEDEDAPLELEGIYTDPWWSPSGASRQAK